MPEENQHSNEEDDRVDTDRVSRGDLDELKKHKQQAPRRVRPLRVERSPVPPDVLSLLLNQEALEGLAPSIQAQIAKMRQNTEGLVSDEKPSSKPRILSRIIEGEEKIGPFEVVHPNSEQCKSIHEFCVSELSFEEKELQYRLRQIKWTDFSTGWMVETPESPEDVEKDASHTLFIPNPSDPNAVLAFLNYYHVGNGIESEKLQRKMLSISFDSIDGEYRPIIETFQRGEDLEKIAWIDMSAVNVKQQASLNVSGVAELMEFQFLYKMFTEQPQVEYIFSEWMLTPHTNIPSAIFHSKYLGVTPFGSRETKNVRRNMSVQTFKWSLVDHPEYRTMIKRHPERDISFEDFTREYRSLLNLSTD